MNRKRSNLKFEIISTIFVMILGILLHFTFEWSNNNWFIGIFSPVNESTWEHLKLVFFPMLIITIIGYFYYRNEFSNYLCVKVEGILLAMVFIVIFFYTYTGIIGTNFAFLDIGSFFVGVVLGQYHTYKKLGSKPNCNNFAASIILISLIVCFIFFTFFPLHIGLFEDPITGTFGMVQTQKNS